jgi:hypothetical protein
VFGVFLFFFLMWLCVFNRSQKLVKTLYMIDVLNLFIKKIQKLSIHGHPSMLASFLMAVYKYLHLRNPLLS